MNETFQLPVLAGVSRKRMICELLKVKPEQALNGTVVAQTIALLNGASILRVHDVKEAVEAIQIVEAYQHFNSNR
jgi:dihydropteroate synthase